MKKITNETLFRAIGELDEDLIAEAREETPVKEEKEKKTHRFPLRRVLSAAACFAAVFAVSLALLSLPAAMQMSEADEWNGEADGEGSVTGYTEASLPDCDTGKAATREEILPPGEAADTREELLPSGETDDQDPEHNEKTGKDVGPGENDREGQMPAEPVGTDDGTAQKSQDTPQPPKKDDGHAAYYDGVFSRKEELIPIGVALGIAALVTVLVLPGAKKKNGKEDQKHEK